MMDSREVRVVSLEGALDMNPVGYFQYRLLLMCGLTFMTDGFEITLMSFLTTCVGVEWGLSNGAKATLTGMVFMGIVIGSLFFGWFADKYGRRPSYLYASFLITAGGFLSSIAPSYSFLVLFRTMTGFGIGGASVPFDLLAEFIPVSHRGKFLACSELLWTVGSMSVAAMAWGTLPTLGWRFLTFACAVPVLFISLFSYVYLPESPRWLLTKHREREANSILRTAALVNGINLPEFILTSDLGKDLHDGSYWDLLSTKEARSITVPLSAIYGLYGFTYYGLILFESRLFSNQDNVASIACEFDYGPIFYNAASEFVAVLLSAAVIDKLGRVRSQSLFYTVGGIGVILIGLEISPTAILVVSIAARMCAMSASVGSFIHSFHACIQKSLFEPEDGRIFVCFCLLLRCWLRVSICYKRIRS